MSINISLQVDETSDINLNLHDDNTFDIELNESSSTFSNSNYETLRNKPKINDIELFGNKSFDELGMNSATTPLMDGTAAVGTETAFARGDHRHPTDTSRAPLASPTFTGTPAAPTAASGTNTTQIATTAFVTSAIFTAIDSITGISYEIVQSLPATGSSGVIYLISNSGSNPNIYDEYIYVNNTFEKIGTTDVDLTDYYNTTNLVMVTNAEIDTIVDS